MRHLNEQLFIAFECISAIGSSLDLKIMVEQFQKVFARKTGALASIYWYYDERQHTYTQLSFQGKKAFLPLFKTPKTCIPCPILSLDETKTKNLLHVKIDEDWMVFLFHAPYTEIELIKNMLESFKEKLENAVHGCKNHSELIGINQKLERLIQEEVAKNREKDQHILQQSRLAQMGEMISMIAHQWRQPLSSISTVAASLKLKLSLNRFDYTTKEQEEANKLFLQESMNKIESYVRFLTHTIDDFRNFFKPNKQKESITLSQLVNRTLGIIGKALEVNGITLHVQTNTTHEVLTYANEMMQVILNILKNAEDIIKEREVKNPQIHITLSSDKTWQIITIEDNAGGIKEEILPHIFAPYFSTKTDKNGTGLGLYMSKTIVEEHCGGQIMASNGAYGALFTIKLKEDATP